MQLILKKKRFVLQVDVPVCTEVCVRIRGGAGGAFRVELECEVCLCEKALSETVMPWVAEEGQGHRVG